ncbi:hypothetical protein [Brevibacillus reuszeri]|uniref:hypothetical protein n=1 Tax=Brevibacillus reuszeri TaxID=54915 RepID=UPI000CCC4DE4|nr:hypothetical protein [Brevibacillus reuszeri]
MLITESKNENKVYFKTILKRLAKVAIVVLAIKMVRWGIKTNPGTHELLDLLTQSENATLVIRHMASLAAIAGVIFLLFGFLIRKGNFFESKIFWFVFSFTILDAILIIVFPEVTWAALRAILVH